MNLILPVSLESRVCSPALIVTLFSDWGATSYVLSSIVTLIGCAVGLSMWNLIDRFVHPLIASKTQKTEMKRQRQRFIVGLKRFECMSCIGTKARSPPS